MDDELESEQQLVIIGGAAILLGYGVPIATRDIDAMSSIIELTRAYERAVGCNAFDIPFGAVAVADAPYDYEERLRPVKRPALRKLRVLVPEKHDLALMKTIRGDRRDLEAIRELHCKVKLSRRKLEQRFKEEMGHVIGDPRRLKLSFERMIEFVFDDVPS